MWRPFYFLMRTGGGRHKEKLKTIAKNKALRESVMTDEKGFAKNRSVKAPKHKKPLLVTRSFLGLKIWGDKEL